MRVETTNTDLKAVQPGGFRLSLRSSLRLPTRAHVAACRRVFPGSRVFSAPQPYSAKRGQTWRPVVQARRHRKAALDLRAASSVLGRALTSGGTYC